MRLCQKGVKTLHFKLYFYTFSLRRTTVCYHLIEKSRHRAHNPGALKRPIKRHEKQSLEKVYNVTESTNGQTFTNQQNNHYEHPSIRY